MLSQHFTVAHHRSTALQVAHEALQVSLLPCPVKLTSLARSCDAVILIIVMATTTTTTKCYNNATIIMVIINNYN